MSGKHRARKSVRHKTGYAVGGVALAGAAALVVNAGTAHAEPDWGPLISCESGGNAQAQNPSSTASGLFQFLDTSWAAYGGTKYAARAKDATPAQQYEVANRAYAMSGLNPWAASRGCWGGKVSTTAKPAPVVKSAAPAPTAGQVGSYVVQAGDTLGAIAATHQVAGGWEQLAALNRGVVSDPNVIFPGQQLRVR